MRFWRIVAGDPEFRSKILGDWLRKNYISIGYDDPNQVSRRRFDEMEIGDRVVVVADGYIFAIGEVTSELYMMEEPDLYDYRRDVLWYKVTKERYDEFPPSLKNKLSYAQTMIELSRDEWESLVLHLIH